jgi:hypothetical protein
MTSPSPHTQEELLAAFRQQALESVAYWNAFDTAAFFQKIGSSWSPAETVRHLTKSTRPVVKALGLPRLMLRVMFGRPHRPSQTFDQFRDGYLKALSEGGQAGRFAPSSKSEDDREAWRAAIMGDFERVNRELQSKIARWPDSKLDRLQLPHPLLGNLTVREMLFFTLYHQAHHIDVVDRRMRTRSA